MNKQKNGWCKMDEKIICINCMKEFKNEEELKAFTDLSQREVRYFKGCPKCGTDEYLREIK